MAERRPLTFCAICGGGFQPQALRAQPSPVRLPRERVIAPGPTACLCCGGERLRKLGEIVTETHVISKALPQLDSTTVHIASNTGVPVYSAKDKEGAPINVRTLADG
jgi:hypothetical protein